MVKKIELKEITLRFDTKCMGCEREMKKGWKGWFGVDGDKKLLYCKYCKSKVEKGTLEAKVEEVQQEKGSSEAVKLLEEIYGYVVQNNDIMLRIDEQLRDLLKDFSALDNQIRALKPKAKSK